MSRRFSTVDLTPLQSRDRARLRVNLSGLPPSRVGRENSLGMDGVFFLRVICVRTDVHTLHDCTPKNDFFTGLDADG